MTPKKISPVKESKISELTQKMSEAKSVVFVNYAGMGVKGQQELKNRLKKEGATILVAKNTLIELAAKKANIDTEKFPAELFTGQTAVIMANQDSVSPIQILGKFAQEFELPKMKAGVVEGSYQNDKGLLIISKLPAKNVIQAQVVGAFAAPMYSLVGTLQGNLQKLVYILNAKATQK